MSVALLALSLLAGVALFAYDRLAGGDTRLEQTVDEAAGGAVTKGFGTPVAIDATVQAVPGAEKLRGSLFPIGCEPGQGTANGIAYMVALSGLPRGEVAAFASASALSACMDRRSAYLHDGVSALRVTIAAYDPETKVVRIAVPAPLPAQAIRLVDEVGPTLVATISGGAQSLVPEAPGTPGATGAPLLDTEGYALGLVAANGERITTGQLCGTLLSC